MTKGVVRESKNLHWLARGPTQQEIDLMTSPVSLVDRFSGLKLRSPFSHSARLRRRRSDRRWQVAAEVSMLEDRCLLSRAALPHPDVKDPSQSTIYVASRDGDSTIGPYTLQNVAGDAGAVMFLGGTSPNTPGMNWGTVPEKSVSFTNKSNNKKTIYPFLYSPNNERIYDPIDSANDEYRLYIGYEDGGKYVLGLPYGKTVTIEVPLVFWNGGRADIATDGPHLLPQPGEVNDLNPYQFRYTASTYITKQGVIDSNDNGILMYYKANTVGAPNDPSPAAAGQLTEWTIRDQSFLTTVNAYDQANKIGTIPASELTTLVNYDVSYVDDMTAPVAMNATKVPIPIQYIQNGTATTQANTTTISLSAPAAALLQLLTTTYPYSTDQWQVKYNVSKTSTIDVGTVTQVSGDTVTVVSSGPVTGLPTSTASYVFYTNSVKADYGWTGANNDIVQMQKAMLDFTTKNTKDSPNTNGLGDYFGGLGWPEYYNPDPDALLKIPSGASILINSPLTTKTSPYDITHYLLTSGNGGKQFFFHAHEDLDPTSQATNAGDVITVKVSGADLAAIKTVGGTWVLSSSPNTAGSNLIGTIDVKSIDVADRTVKVTLNQTIQNDPSGYSYLVVAPPRDPYATKMTDLWYSWANYYVNQFSTKTAPGAITATVTADADSSSDTRILTPTSTPAAPFEVGMEVTGDGISSLTTILKIVGNALYLSAPVSLAAGTQGNFQVLNPQPIAYSNDPGLNDTLINAADFGNNAAYATAFAASVYELMSNYSTVAVNHSRLPNRSMDVVYEAIGGNVGFLPSNVNTLTAITSDVRDLGKSVLRGVPNFIAYPDQHLTDSEWQPGAWYPPPSTPTDGTDYNVYNLDPFVWFVHQKVGLSGYGFSFDDDVSDVGAGGASSLVITYASGPTANPVSSQWFPSTPWGTVTAMATISPAPADLPPNSPYAGKSFLTILPQDAKAFWEVSADDSNNGLVGAYVSTTAPGITIPTNTNLFANYNSNTLQFVLSTSVTPTTIPIPVTFTGYPPQALKMSKRRR